MLSVTQLDERIEKCLAILADNPHSQVFAALADAYRKRGEFGRAFAVCKSGLRHHADYAPAHIVMAKLYLHQSMYDDAIQSLKVAETQDGVTRASEHLEAEILIGMREFDRARALIDRLRTTDRGNPAVKELAAQLKAAQSASVGSSQPAEPARLHDDARPVEPSTSSTSDTAIDWTAWAAELAARPHVLRAFAVGLNESGTTPSSVLAEQGRGIPDTDAVSICTALFASIDANCRGKGVGTVVELRVERLDGEIWCRRLPGCVIGFAGEGGLSYGALRQMALDGAARVSNPDTSQ